MSDPITNNTHTWYYVWDEDRTTLLLITQSIDCAKRTERGRWFFLNEADDALTRGITTLKLTFL